MAAAQESNRFFLFSCILCVTVGVCYLRALDCGFVFDDHPAIVKNNDLRPRTPWKNLFLNDFWGTPMSMEKSHKSYRPLCVVTFRFNYILSELEPMLYHLFNVILHAVVCIMYMKMCNMFIQELPSFIAAMLFAVHPVHTEVVTGVVGRAESLSSIFFIAALMSYAKCTGYRRETVWAPLFTSIGLVTIAMLCKEQGITVIGVCVVYELFVAQRALFKELWEILMRLLQGDTNIPKWLQGSIVRSGVLVGSTMFLLIARITIMGAQLPVFTRFENTASVSNTPARQLTYNYLLPINFWILLFPADLCCDWTMGTIPVIKSIVDPRNLITLLFYLSLAKFVHFCFIKQGKLNRAIIMCLALMVLPFIPASNLFFPVGFVVAERILYTPSMGFCMLIAVGFDRAMQNKKMLKAVFWFMMVCLLFFHAGKTYFRNIEWNSEYTLFKSALKVNVNNAKLWNNVGHALENQQKFEEALEYFKTATGVQPDDIGAHMNVGRTYYQLEKFEEAEEAFNKAKDLFPAIIPGKGYTERVAPDHLNVFLHLATLCYRDPNRLEEAEKLLKTATDMRPDYVQAYINRGDLYMKMDRKQDAMAIYELALTYEPENAHVHFNLGMVHMQLGNKPKAIECFEKALSIDPEHWQSLYNTAIIIQEDKQTDRWQVAVDRLQLLLTMRKNDSQPPFIMAMLAMDMRDFVAAETYFKLALEINPTFDNALYNIALMLKNDGKRPLEAVSYLRKLLETHPRYVKGLMLLGELNVIVLKNFDEAEQCFTKVLQIEANNTEALHNLCVVYVERGDIFRGEKCLSHVHNLVPHEAYILKHLNIVRKKINDYLEKKKAKEAEDEDDSEDQDQAGQGQQHGQTAQVQGQASQGQQQGQVGQEQHQGQTAQDQGQAAQGQQQGQVSEEQHQGQTAQGQQQDQGQAKQGEGQNDDRREKTDGA